MLILLTLTLLVFAWCRNFAVAAGTDVIFQVTDGLLQQATSPPITVTADLTIQFPTTPESGVAQSIQWKGGFAPYTISVLSPDVSDLPNHSLSRLPFPTDTALTEGKD